MEKEGSTLLLPIAKPCKMQGQILTSNMFQRVNMSRAINLL